MLLHLADRDLTAGVLLLRQRNRIPLRLRQRRRRLLPGWRLGFAGYAACFAAANLLLCAVLHRWLRKKGAALFAAL